MDSSSIYTLKWKGVKMPLCNNRTSWRLLIGEMVQLQLCTMDGYNVMIKPIKIHPWSRIWKIFSMQMYIFTDERKLFYRTCSKIIPEIYNMNHENILIELSHSSNTGHSQIHTCLFCQKNAWQSNEIINYAFIIYTIHLLSVKICTSTLFWECRTSLLRDQMIFK